MTTTTAQASRNDLHAGDILASSWGYEQTNWDFYQVIKTTARFVVLRKLRTRRIECVPTMTGKIKPIANEFAGEPIRRKVHQAWDGEAWNVCDIEDYEIANPWDGVAKSFSSYA